MLRRMLGGELSKIENDYEWLSVRAYHFTSGRCVSQKVFCVDGM